MEAGHAMYKHILFPTDGSECSAIALAAVVPLAKALNARITAINLMPPYEPSIMDLTLPHSGVPSLEQFEAGARQESVAILARVADEARFAGVACETLSATSGAPWDTILTAARQGKCDLIFMASHGRRGLAAALLGSETQKVIAHSSLPVLVCR
jgi:nucleotide-binding universal stress UspA family protein